MAEAPEPSLDDHLWTIAVTRLLMPVGRRRPGAAEPRARRVPAPARGRHRRLRRRLPGDARPRQSRGAVARARAARSRDGGRRPHARAAALHLPALPARRRALARHGRARPRAGGIGRRGPRARRGHLVRRHEPRAAGRLAGRTPPAPRRHRLARRSSARSTAASAAATWTRPMPRRCSRRAAPRSSCCSRRPTRGAPSAPATPSRTSSAGTSTTPTSATSAAASARSRRAGWRPTCAARRTCSASTRSCAAAPRRGIAAPPRSASRAASTRASPAPGTSSSCARSARRCPTCTCTRSRRSRSGRARRPRAGTLRDYLEQLRDAGLGSLPGTAAEILDDEVRRILCPDKLRTEQWLEVMRTAHAVGLRTTSTIMFGHIEAPINQARHILAIRDLQRDTGGFTEFVPLPFVHEEAPIALKGAGAPRTDVPRGRRVARGRAPDPRSATCRASRPPGSSSARTAPARSCTPASTTSAARS